jgi:hypothetical protein
MTVGERIAQLSGLSSGNLFEHLASIKKTRIVGAQAVSEVSRIESVSGINQFDAVSVINCVDTAVGLDDINAVGVSEVF